MGDRADRQARTDDPLEQRDVLRNSAAGCAAVAGAIARRPRPARTAPTRT
ncbi:twin-arginine translocation signal domain-containing protein [Micromonospora tulbaghiae]